MKINYTDEKNIQMLIGLLKQSNIKKIIVNPGTMNMSFVASVQNDPFFELYSCVDERSACYMACGLSVESGEPVVLTCTGATASRNYMPGLTEAFYRKIPVIAVTATPHTGRVNHNMPQILDRSIVPNDVVKMSVQVPSIDCDEDEWNCNILINKVLLELKHHGGGPVHINLGTTLTRNFSVSELPVFRKIDRICYCDELPLIDSSKKVAIFIGAHRPFNDEFIAIIEEFCEKYNAFVICDHTSNYFGNYKILGNIICDQKKYSFSEKNIDLLIHIGDVSAAYLDICTKEVWRVNPDGEIKDTFKRLTKVFEMDEIDFFKKYNNIVNSKRKTTFYNSWKNIYDELHNIENENDYPFSNIWISKNTISSIKENSVVHLAILNTVRSWNYFENKKNIQMFTNSGGFGIDGIMSTLVGASLNNNDKNFYCIIGDLAFFYDLNILGNRHIKNNIRIMLINNGCGTEFHNYSHPANLLGNEMISNYIGADGHFGNKSINLVKHYAEDLGFEYISASNKEEFNNNIDYFTSEEIYNKPIIFEIFTNSKDESDALNKIRTLNYKEFDEIKDKVKKAVPKSAKDKIKKILGK